MSHSPQIWNESFLMYQGQAEDLHQDCSWHCVFVNNVDKRPLVTSGGTLHFTGWAKVRDNEAHESQANIKTLRTEVCLCSKRSIEDDVRLDSTAVRECARIISFNNCEGVKVLNTLNYLVTTRE